jgi:hypothetical protein
MLNKLYFKNSVEIINRLYQAQKRILGTDGKEKEMVHSEKNKQTWAQLSRTLGHDKEVNPKNT